ncbi:NAD-dependent epimerase/dehydratase family protein [Saccharomonospora sp. NB11]|uniref:NAD-dependent epimerase/dehydratase family protein n=1 Tax=Saccharomonospora sp. NB11 TaxID=1642298 RepID=UPI0018D112EE|nr:NAD-dependent epimerase/dehydratase family protein [Saccharomonospora sp. NB11]
MRAHYFPTHSRNTAAPVAVIGAAGFLGRNLVNALASTGVQPFVFTRDQPFVRRDRLHRALLRCKTIFFLAGSITPSSAEREPQRVADDQRLLTTLLRGLRDCDRPPLVVLASSGGTVYDPTVAPPYRENDPTRPVNAYGRAKLAQEAQLLDSREWIVPVILRFANIYGPGQRAGAGFGVIAHWIRAVLADTPVRMIGQTKRDYLHVHDATAALVAVCRHHAMLREQREAVVLNIGSGVPTSLQELHGYLERALGRTIPVRREPARAFDRTDVWLDVEAARRRLAWTPRIDLVPGLAETLDAAIGEHALPRQSRFG